jgi:hypothetical protein
MSSARTSHFAVAGTRSTTEAYHAHCFSDAADVAKFKQRFGGEKFNLNQKAMGRNWARWNRP